jgi:thiamine biosynthesis lipoprotein
MGTTYSITLINDENKIDKKQLEVEIEKVLKKVNMEMSTFIDKSEISKFNSSNSINWFPVSKDFAKVVKNSLDISEQSNGAFDVTVGPLIELWGFGRKTSETIPSDKAIDLTSTYIGYEKLHTQKNPPALKKDMAKLQINLSAIAKGYGVDRVAEFLVSKGIVNYLVEIGGEIRAGGNKYGKKWRIGIVIPDTISKYDKIINISNISFATSGDYFNYFEKNGKRYSHTIDPKTKRPITHKLASVTVGYKTCMMADGYATTINVMGQKKGYEFALKKHLPVYMIIRGKSRFIIKMTPSFKQFF